jgi:tetratricopeptide (TPR) repeat protein
MKQHATSMILAAALAVVAAGGCAASSPDKELREAREQLRAGKLLAACQRLERLAAARGPRAAQLEALRSWIACLSRSGELRRARPALDGRAEDGGKLYALALVRVAQAPANLPGALRLLERAGRSWPDQGEIPYRAAVLLLADARPAAALTLLRRAGRLDDSAAVAAARAHALLDLGRTTEALRQVRRVPQLKPGPVDIRRGRALIRRIARRTRRIPRAAVPLFREALDALHQHDRAGECIRKVEELLMDHPRLAAAHTLLGLANFRLGNTAVAVVALRRAAKLNPLDPTNPLYQALIVSRRGRLTEAATHFRAALELDPFHVQAARELGKILLAAHRPGEAARVLQQLPALDGGTELGLRLAGRAHFQAGALEEAQAYYTRLLKESPEDFELNLRLGQILLRRFSAAGDGHRELLERASRHAEQAAKVRPQDPELDQLLEAIKRSLR